MIKLVTKKNLKIDLEYIFKKLLKKEDLNSSDSQFLVKTIFNEQIDNVELTKVKDAEDAESLKSKTEQLVQSSLKLGEAIYKQSPQGKPEQPGSSNPEPPSDKSDKKDEKVVDADFEEVDENKKD